jgi:hypothetical protein
MWYKCFYYPELIQQDDLLDLLNACGYSAQPSFGDKDKLSSMITRCPDILPKDKTLKTDSLTNRQLAVNRTIFWTLKVCLHTQSFCD